MSQLIPITEICDFQGGTQPPKNEWIKDPEDGYVRMLQIRDFTQPEKNNVEYVVLKKHTKTCKKEDILIGRYGASIGKICTGLEGAYNVALIKTKPDLKRINRRYLFHILQSVYFQNFILSVGSRAAQAGFNKEDLTKFKIPLPPLKTQQHIAQILDDAAALRDKTKQLLTEYDLLAQAIFLEMFGDPDSFEHFTIAEVAAKERYSLSSGPFGSNLTSKHYTEKGIVILRGTNVTSGILDLSNVKYVSEEKAVELKRSEIKPDDVVIVAVGSSGKALKIPSTLKRAIMSQNFNKITPDRSKVIPLYLEFCFNSQLVQNQFRTEMTDTVRTFLSLTKIKQVKIPIPPIELQNQFAEKIALIEQQKELAKQELKESEDLFNALLQKAFKGEL
ncbi:restriction endonuclease subunit S [Gelidibacter maritimus]|uniref:Restriction endonuclease subunit S n=1 Tax=Gelidibacter maritimus TaxID=2761487 RepID=A0A7W2M2S8_9FLAO|nr:restriction endonuclease subunit S [Gelidibacter maritimus]MBA6151446.1 restriction endonuclease subunit S [Gelidibacter maritimus]